MIKILVVHIYATYIFLTESTGSDDAFVANMKVTTPSPEFSHIELCVSECTTQVPFSNNKLCRFHIRQWVRVGTVEPISVDSKWASDTFEPITKTLWIPFGYLCIKKLIYSEGTLQHYLLLLFNICLVLKNFNNSGFTYIRCSKWKVYAGWVSQSSDVS